MGWGVGWCVGFWGDLLGFGVAIVDPVDINKKQQSAGAHNHGQRPAKVRKVTIVQHASAMRRNRSRQNSRKKRIGEPFKIDLGKRKQALAACLTLDWPPHQAKSLKSIVRASARSGRS